MTVRTQKLPYAWPWFGAMALSAFLAFYLMFIRPQIPMFKPLAYQVSGENTYLLIQMPNISSRETELESKAESWLRALKSKGYSPMLLSAVHERMKKGEGLPSKAVVLVFDPGYRTTFNVMAPLLAKHKFPAVWITDAHALRKADRRFVSHHKLEAMKKSGLWDVAHYEGDGIFIQTRDIPPVRIGGRSGVWKQDSGRRALNRGVPEGELNRLYVNWNWTNEQIVDRLEAEAPVRRKSFLTYKKIQNHKWGVVMPVTSKEDPVFTLKAPIDSRTATISWLGTKWCDDARFDLEAKAFSGELWLLLRSDEVAGNNVGICFQKGKLSIVRHVGNRPYPLLVAMVPGLVQPAPLSANVVINGSALGVWVNGVKAAETWNLPEPSEEGSVRMVVYDKIVGAAQVESLKLSVAPIGKDEKGINL